MPSKEWMKRKARTERYESEKHCETDDAKNERLDNIYNQRRYKLQTETESERRYRLALHSFENRDRSSRLRVTASLQSFDVKLASKIRPTESLSRMKRRRFAKSYEQRVLRKLIYNRNRSSAIYATLSAAAKARLIQTASSRNFISRCRHNFSKSNTQLPPNPNLQNSSSVNTSEHSTLSSNFSFGDVPFDDEGSLDNNPETSSASHLPPFQMSTHIEAFLADIESIQYNECSNCSSRFPNLKLKPNTTICMKCSRSEKNAKNFSPANNMDPGPIPVWFMPYTDLTTIEHMLIAQVMPLMTVYRLPYGQYGYKGHVINFAQDIQTFVTKLPRRLTANDILIVRRPGAAGTHKDFKVRRSKVLGALEVLTEHNPYYKDISIDNIAVDELPEDGDYMSSHCTIDIDDDLSTEISSSTTVSHPSSTTATPTSTPLSTQLPKIHTMSSQNDGSVTQESQFSGFSARELLAEHLHFLRNYGRYSSQDSSEFSNGDCADEVLQDDWSRYLSRIISQSQQMGSQRLSQTTEGDARQADNVDNFGTHADREKSATGSSLVANLYRSPNISNAPDTGADVSQTGTNVGNIGSHCVESHDVNESMADVYTSATVTNASGGDNARQTDTTSKTRRHANTVEISHRMANLHASPNAPDTAAKMHTSEINFDDADTSCSDTHTDNSPTVSQLLAKSYASPGTCDQYTHDGQTTEDSCYSPTINQRMAHPSRLSEYATVDADPLHRATTKQKSFTIDDLNRILQQNIADTSLPHVQYSHVDDDASDETGFVPAPLNTNSERQAVAGRFAEVIGSDNTEVRWPSIQNAPIDEFNIEGYVVRAFPALFPTGTADYNAPRPYDRPTIADYYAHLMRYKDGRFEKDPRFRYFAMNTIYRHRALSCGRVFVKQNPGEARLTDDDIKRMSPGEQKALLSKMTRFGANIRGTPQYWSSKRNELVHFIDQLGTPTLFFTLSSADFHWPDLQRLLPQGVNRATALADNPSLVDWFSYHLMHSFVKFILMKHFPGKEYWFRVEWQARGSLHVHGLLIIINAPDIIALLNDQIYLDAQFAQFVDEYCHAWNPAFDENGKLHTTLTSSNPSAVRLSSITNFDNDYTNLVNACQRHTRCMEKYCLRKKKGSKTLECRFGFPKPLCQQTTVVRDLDNENQTQPKLTIETKRNDPLLNRHNRTALQVVRANVDFQPIDSKEKLIGYILKYTTKTEIRSQSLIDLFKSLVNYLGPTDDVRVLAQKILIKTVGERDYSAQEVCHNIHQIPDVSCSRSFLHLNISGSRELGTDDGAVTIPNALDKYFSRPKRPVYDISLLEFSKRYFVQGGQVRPHTKEPVIVIHPSIPDDENHPRRDDFCRNYLLLHKTMYAITELFDGFPDCKSAYEAFINIHGKRPSFSRDMHQTDRNNVPTEEDDEEEEEEHNDDHVNEDVVPGRATEDWMLLCERQPEFLPLDPNSHDWFTNDHEYNIDDMVSFVDRAKRNVVVSHQNVNEIINTDTLNETQRDAFDLVKNHFDNQSSPKEPLRLIVSGTAGTGKSYLIKCIKQLMGERCRVLAPTGVAAHNINGETLHRCFRLGIAINDNTPALSGDALMEAQNENASVDLFIIDEMSMVGKKLFRMIDRRMRQVFPEYATLPFGGKSVVLVGDFGQLNPVCDAPLYSGDGKSKLADIGGAMYTEFKQPVVLGAAMRQIDDEHFLGILSRIRNDQVTMSDYVALSKRFDGRVSSADRARFDSAIKIFPKVQQVAEYNLNELKKLSKYYPTVRIDAVHTGGANAAKASSDEAGGLPRMLFLCKTARVMLTTNLWVEKGLCNGSMGTVIDIVYDQHGPPALPKFIVVQFDKYSGPSCIPGIPNCVPIIPIRRFWSSSTGLCSRQIIPLALSWAITVHKSQGLTLPFACVDLSNTEFCPQLTFVALSRSPKLDNLLLTPFTFTRLKKLYNGKRFMERYAEDVRLKQLYETSKNGSATERCQNVSYNADSTIVNLHPICQPANSPESTPNGYHNARLSESLIKLPQQPHNAARIPRNSTTAKSKYISNNSNTPPIVANQHSRQSLVTSAKPVSTNINHIFLPLENAADKFCYSNAVIQCLLAVPCLAQTVNIIDNNVGYELGNLIHYAIAGVPSRRESLFSTNSLRCAIDATLGAATYCLRRQRDAVEFLNDLISCLPGELQNHFLLHRKQRSTCQTCRTVKQYDCGDTFGIDHLFMRQDAGQFITLNSLLANTTTDNNQCHVCGCNRRHELSNLFATGEATDCLIINLPIFLDQTSRLTYEVLPFECGTIEFDGSTWMLNGCVLHQGETIHSGHYTSYSRKDNKWLNISDDRLIGYSSFLPSLQGCQMMVYVKVPSGI